MHTMATPVIITYLLHPIRGFAVVTKLVILVGNVTMRVISNHSGHRKFGNKGKHGGKGNHRNHMNSSTIGKHLGKADICD